MHGKASCVHCRAGTESSRDMQLISHQAVSYGRKLKCLSLLNSPADWPDTPTRLILPVKFRKSIIRAPTTPFTGRYVYVIVQLIDSFICCTYYSPRYSAIFPGCDLHYIWKMKMNLPVSGNIRFVRIFDRVVKKDEGQWGRALTIVLNIFSWLSKTIA